MLTLRLQSGQPLRIGDDVVIIARRRPDGCVDVSVDAPRHIKISRVDETHPINEAPAMTARLAVDAILDLLATSPLDARQLARITRAVAAAEARHAGETQ